MTPAKVAERIRDTGLAEALGERYLAYAVSTIMARSLPDVRDGLKPVHRRLLYAMRLLKLDPGAGFKKCARVVGDVIGKYHPHGDAAVYDALVRLAQEFAVRYPLVEGQGNFGNVDGDNPAAMRYTEARLTEVARLLLEGIDDGAVDFRSTYDGLDSEPRVLPANFPNLLANGATGIAVGMATSIPPHNAAELCDALLHLIEHPNAHFDKLVDLVPGPDFPTGGVLVEPRAGIVAAYRSGRGSFRLRARWRVEKMPRGLWHAVVTEIPYQVQKSRLIERIATLLDERKLPLLADVRDESTTDVRIVLEPKSRQVDPGLLMEHLFRETELETRVGLNLNVLDGGQTPKVMNLRDALQAFLDHRHEVLVRVSRRRLERIEERIEILDGFLVAFRNLDRIIRIVRESDEPKRELMRAFRLSALQADAILDMRLRQLRRLEEAGIEREHGELTRERARLKSLLANEGKRWQAIAGEIAELKKTFSPKSPLGRRRTEIGVPPKEIEVPVDALIEREPITVVASEKGWIRALKGHGADAGEIKYKEGDRARFVVACETTDKLLVFATNGRFYTLPCDRLPGGRGHGEPLRLMIDLGNDEDAVAMFLHAPGRRLVVASDAGRGFVVAEDDVIAQTRNGKQVLNVAPGEEARACAAVAADADAVAAVGENRKLLVFPFAELPVMGRGRGVILQRYAEGKLSDVTTLKLKQGLVWRSGAGSHVESDVRFWVGKRAQAGRVAPKGFPRSNRFT